MKLITVSTVNGRTKKNKTKKIVIPLKEKKMKIKRQHIIRTILIITGLIIIILARKLYIKYKESEKLIIGEIKLIPTKTLTNISNIIEALKTGLQLKGHITIKNYSKKQYTISQIKIDCLSPESQKIIAEQTNILSEDIILNKKSETQIPLEYNINLLNIQLLLKESKVIPSEVPIWQIVSKINQYLQEIKIRNLELILKGFIKSEGITLEINQTLKPYDK